MKVEVKDFIKYIQEHPNISKSDIARYFEISRPTVRNYLSRLNIDFNDDKNFKHNFDENELKAFVENNPNITIKEVAKHFNISTTTVSRWLGKLGITKIDMRIKDSRISEEELKEYMKTHPKVTLTQAAKDLGVSVSTLAYTIKKYGFNWEDNRKVKKNERTKNEGFKNTRIIIKVIELMKQRPDLTLEKILSVLEKKGVHLSKDDVVEYERRMKQQSKNDEER